MHWTDSYKSFEELKAAIKDKDRVLKDGESIRVTMLMRDGATASRNAITDGMKMVDVASAIAGRPLFAHLGDAELRHEAVRCRMGNAMVDGKSDEIVAAAFDTLVAISAGQIAYKRSNIERSNAWRHGR